jgi:hypothetical protein
MVRQRWHTSHVSRLPEGSHRFLSPSLGRVGRGSGRGGARLLVPPRALRPTLPQAGGCLINKTVVRQTLKATRTSKGEVACLSHRISTIVLFLIVWLALVAQATAQG